MATYKTPDVYIEEISVFPPSVAEVGTAIPAFIGYTQKADSRVANDLILKPTKIYSLKEYEAFYGFPNEDQITVGITRVTTGAPAVPTGAFLVSSFSPADLPPAIQVSYLLYYAVKMYFDNGGAQCYIVSVGTYQAAPVFDLAGDATTSPATGFGLQDGLDVVKLEDEPTLIVIPEAVKLTAGAYPTLVQAVLKQCADLKDRFGIFDVREGATSLDPAALLANRNHFGNNNLKYGAAYYPFLKTSMNYFVNETEDNVDVRITS